MKKFAVVLAVVLFGCNSKSVESTGITAAAITCPTNNTLTYENFAKDLVATKCLSCHSGKERPTLATQALLKSNTNDILQEAVYTTSMPEEGDLTNDERLKLGQWLSCGAP
jgi:uncharacterized membrane protein